MIRPVTTTPTTQASPISLSSSGSVMSSRKGVNIPTEMRLEDRRMIWKLRLLRQEKSKKGSLSS